MVKSDYAKVKEKIFKLQKLKLKAKKIDIMTGGTIVVLNAQFAHQNNIFTGYRVRLFLNKKQITAIVDLTNDMVKPGEIGLFHEAATELKAKDGQIVELMLTRRPKSIEYIKSKIEGHPLHTNQMASIIDDVMANRLSEGELSAFMTSCYIHNMNDDEVVGLTDAIVNSGEKLKLKKKPILDKHCIGGVAGNRTTMILVPIVAAAGCYIPKSSSRAITSAAGTADTMELLCSVNLPIEDVQKQVNKIGGCIVWGGAINLAAADDKLIKVRNPLSLDPRGVLLASILAKKKSVGAQYCIIDLPVGRGVKIADVAQARQFASDFINIGKRLGIKIESLITNGEDPIGKGIGPALECRDVLQVLEGSGPHDLREKSCLLTGKLFELCGKAKKGRGAEMASNIIDNGKALKKFKQIVEWQGGNARKLTSDSIPLGKYTHKIKASRSGRISHVDNKLLARVARATGAPADKYAGIYLHCEKGDMVKKGDTLMDLYSNSEHKLSIAIKVLQGFEPIEMEKVVLDSLR
ncbi:MAG: AMP phosphorylase [Candidatus Micrarchaeota archaeon]